MLLAFLLGCYVGWSIRKTTPTRKLWAEIVVFALVTSLVFSLFSVCVVWTPYVTNEDLHQGEFAGYFPLSTLSYPLYLVTYHTPLANMSDNIGNVSFNIFLSGFKVLGFHGHYWWPAIYGRGPIGYQLDPPFENAITFFFFLLSLFIVLNIIMVALGTLLTYGLTRRRALFLRPRRQ
jgi:hypothetical protein